MTRQRMFTLKMMATLHDHGDVLLAYYPFTNHSTAKLRPVLVVSTSRFNTGGDIVVLPISSSEKAAGLFGYRIRHTDSCFAREAA